MKKLFVIFLVLLSINSIAQDDKTVTIVANGQGKTIEDARQAALRSAIEQAFGAFISSKIEIFNDHVVADQMSSVSSGNIKSFDILTQDQLPDGRWGVTLKAIVSVDKLTSFVQAKGIEVEINGGMLALNIKQQLLNEQSEIQAIVEMVGVLHEVMQTAFDYEIKSSEPKSLDAESNNWKIQLGVKAICNKNIDICANYFSNTIRSLSLSESEVESYKSLNKQVFGVTVKYGDHASTYFLRKQSSLSAINSFISNWSFYTRLFAVQSGKDEYLGRGNGRIFRFSESANSGRIDYSKVDINFPSSGETAAVFGITDKKTLNQIEQMTEYSVKPRGVISKFKNGGYLVYEKNGHGLVIALFDVGEFNWIKAKSACDNFVLNGFNDWRLPSKLEIKIIYDKLYSYNYMLGIRLEKSYWTSTEINKTEMFRFDFSSGDFVDEEFSYKNKEDLEFVRAVRSF